MGKIEGWILERSEHCIEVEEAKFDLLEQLYKDYKERAACHAQ